MKGYRSDWNSNEFDESATIVNGWGTSDFFKMSEGRQEYTGEKITEPVTALTAGAGTHKLAWGPVKAKAIEDAAGVAHDYKIISAAGVETYGDFANQAALAARLVAETVAEGDRICYCYDNAYIPAEQLPTVVMKMSSKPVTAGIKRIAIKYSKLAAYEAKKEYGFDLQSELVKQATTELEYSTDNDILKLLIAMGNRNVAAGPAYGNFTFIDEELPTLSVALKAEGFLRVLKKAQAALYKQTARFQANWMLCGPDAMTVISFLPNFKGSDAGIGNGAYCAGSLDGMKVFVTPAITDGSCYLGVLGKEMDCAPAAYLPYMPITPSSLIDLPDDTTTQGLTICSMY